MDGHGENYTFTRQRAWSWRSLPLPEQHLAAIGGGLLLQRSLPLRLPHWLVPPGWVLLAVGAGLNLQAVRERGGGDVDHSDTLATAGLHGVTRNPMYLGWRLIHLGVGLATRSPWVAATWPLSVLLIHRLVLGEEVELAQRFGNEFEAYRSRVPRYLPHSR